MVLSWGVLWDFGRKSEDELCVFARKKAQKSAGARRKLHEKRTGGTEKCMKNALKNDNKKLLAVRKNNQSFYYLLLNLLFSRPIPRLDLGFEFTGVSPSRTAMISCSFSMLSVNELWLRSCLIIAMTRFIRI